MRLGSGVGLTHRGKWARGGGAVPHTYWRLLITAHNGSAYNVSSGSEVQFRATPGGADQSVGGTPFGTEGSDVNFLPPKAFDNNYSTSWGTYPTQIPVHIGYQFVEPVEVTEIAYAARHDSFGPSEAMKDGEVQWSDDGVTWTTEWAITGQTGWAASEERIFTKP